MKARQLSRLCATIRHYRKSADRHEADGFYLTATNHETTATYCEHALQIGLLSGYAVALHASKQAAAEHLWHDANAIGTAAEELEAIMFPS